MRRRTRKCRMPGCGVIMTNKPGRPNSKHLDHILPRNQGGTHTHGNVRIICAACNLRRPKDGSDFAGQLTLWAQEPGVVSRSDRRKATRKGCRKGLHPWVPENVVMTAGGLRCKACRPAPLLLNCRCGSTFPAGRGIMCPTCTEATAHRAGELHASGATWKQVAAAVGYRSGQGIRDVAMRYGYKPASRERAAREWKCPRCACGDRLRLGSRYCDTCLRTRAEMAVHMRFDQGMTLEQIAFELGYTSKSSVTNLMKTVISVECQVGRPRRRAATSKPLTRA